MTGFSLRLPNQNTGNRFESLYKLSSAFFLLMSVLYLLYNLLES